MRLLKVQGKGSVAAEPDMVTVSFDVEVKVRDYEECLRTLNTRADDLRQSMATSGLNRAQLKTTAFNVQVESQYKDGKHVFAGYRASHRMQIELPMDKNALNEVLRHVAKGHSGAKISLAFSVRDKDALRKKVLVQAVQAAKENAATLALRRRGQARDSRWDREDPHSHFITAGAEPRVPGFPNEGAMSCLFLTAPKRGGKIGCKALFVR